MTTFTALTTLPGEAEAQSLAEALERLKPAPTGVGCFEMEDGSGLWEIGGYFVERPDETGLLLLAAAFGAKPFVVSKVEDRDWVAQVRRELSPVAAGRFVVYGSHDAPNVPSNKIGLEIDAAMAFGTGHHSTTLGCLLSFDRLRTADLVAENVADIGCGTGVLAMAAKKSMPYCEAIASDIDPVATATAEANMRWNGLGSSVRCVTSVGFRHQAIRDRAPYDLVFANILAGPLKKLAPDMSRFVSKGGVIILSGILNRQAQGVETVYQGFGFRREHKLQIGEWTTFTFRKY